MATENGTALRAAALDAIASVASVVEVGRPRCHCGMFRCNLLPFLFVSQAVAPLFPQAAAPHIPQTVPPHLPGASHSSGRRAFLAEIQASGTLRRHGSNQAGVHDQPAKSVADTVAKLLERLQRVKAVLVNLRPSPALTRTALVAPADADADAATAAASRRRLLLQEITARRRRILGGEEQPLDLPVPPELLAPEQPEPDARVEGAFPGPCEQPS